MITEDYCSYEVAKLLKEKGFNGEIHTTFDKEGYTQPSITHQMAMKWLRERYKIMITIIPQEFNVGVDKMCYVIYRITEDLYQPLYNGKVDNLVDSYEEDVEAALKYSLKNLI